MLPPVRPAIRSMSQGVSTCVPTMALRRLGAYSRACDDRLAEGLALRVVPAALEVVGRVLHEARHHVVPRRRHVAVDDRGDDDVDVRLLRELRRTWRRRRRARGSRCSGDGDVARGARAVARQAGEVGQSASAIFTLPEEPRIRNARFACANSSGRCFALDELQEGAVRIAAEITALARDLVAVLEHDAARAAALHEHLVDRGAGADLDAEGARRARNRRRHAAGAVLGEAPGAKRAVDLAHVVVQEDVGRAGRTRAEERADDAAHGLRRLQRFALEPLVEQVGRAHASPSWRCGRCRARRGSALLAELSSFRSSRRIARDRVGRHVADHRLDRLRSARHHAEYS